MADPSKTPDEISVKDTQEYDPEVGTAKPRKKRKFKSYKAYHGAKKKQIKEVGKTSEEYQEEERKTPMGAAATGAKRLWEARR